MTDAPVSPSLTEYFERLRAVIDAIPAGPLERIGQLLAGAYTHDRQILVLGNGGSAATASHFASDLSRLAIPPGRGRLRAVSLSDNAPLLTALANDVGYEHVFAEQVGLLADPGDVVVAMSCSGRSPNVVAALRRARLRGAGTIALLGFDGGDAAVLADECLVVSSEEYEVIEDTHMVITHVLVRHLRELLAPKALRSA